jgi:hypothetical protein
MRGKETDFEKCKRTCGTEPGRPSPGAPWRQAFLRCNAYGRIMVAPSDRRSHAGGATERPADGSARRSPWPRLTNQRIGVAISARDLLSMDAADHRRTRGDAASQGRTPIRTTPSNRKGQHSVLDGQIMVRFSRARARLPYQSLMAWEACKQAALI